MGNCPKLQWSYHHHLPHHHSLGVNPHLNELNRAGLTEEPGQGTLNLDASKAARDECIAMNGEEKCKAFIEAHKQCLRAEGFDVK